MAPLYGRMHKSGSKFSTGLHRMNTPIYKSTSSAGGKQELASGI